MANFDVLIAGAGPAGCATALSLATFAPDLRVALVDASRSGEARIGETVPPQINPLMAHLGVWDDFACGDQSFVAGFWTRLWTQQAGIGTNGLGRKQPVQPVFI
jgi:2-polyprenyl-6-methoxyphenol hydroxylase-like FAD-dependent oxidoreductase